MEEDVKMNVAGESCVGFHKNGKELKDMGEELSRVKDRIIELESKMGNICKFNLKVMHSLATSLCLMQEKVLGDAASEEGIHRELFKFLTKDKNNALL